MKILIMMTTNSRRPIEVSRPRSDATQSITADLVAEILADERRRSVLRCLQQYDEPMALADLADEIVAIENGIGTTNTPKESAQDIHLSLYHADIPKLADAGFVEYNRAQDTVILTLNVEKLGPILEQADD